MLRRLIWRLRNGFWRRWYGWGRAGRIMFVLFVIVAVGGALAMGLSG